MILNCSQTISRYLVTLLNTKPNINIFNIINKITFKSLKFNYIKCYSDLMLNALRIKFFFFNAVVHDKLFRCNKRMYLMKWRCMVMHGPS